MISFYDVNGELHPLSDYEDFYVLHKIDGCDRLSFCLPTSHEDYKLLYEECVVLAAGNEWLIKKIDDDRIECELNFDFLRANFYSNFKSETKQLSEVLENHLPSDWRVVGGDISRIRRTIEFDYCTDYDVVYSCISTYDVRFIWDIPNKSLTVIAPELVHGLGEYVTDELNLRSLNFKGSSSSFATRLYAFGKDGMTLEDAMVDDGSGKKVRYGLNYVENRQYADKIVCAYWSDDRYTVPENLYEAAVKRLETMASPVRSYECDVVDLARLNKDYSFLDFSMHKKVTLIDTKRHLKVEHQIVEYKEYPDEPARNVVTLSCVPETIQSSIKNAVTDIHESIAKTEGRMTDAIDNATDWIVNGKKGRMIAIKDPVDGSWNEICSLDTGDIDTALNVWRWNNGGFGHSSNGYKGPFGVAITQDGKIVANFITVGTLTADIVKAGTLSDQNGYNFWNMETGELKMAATATVGGKTVDNIAKDYADSAVDDFVSTVYDPKIAELQRQLDGQIETYYFDYEPSLRNEPASGWKSEDEKKKHEGDLFYWKSKGYSYRFFNDGSSWKWQLVQDTDVTKALADAAAAKDTADNKRRVFVAQPKPPYDEGDLWVQGSGGDILRCAKAKASGSYADGDFIKASKYIDQNAANTAASNAVNGQSQEFIFNKLTDGGKIQGLYMQDGQLYINALYIVAGKISSKNGKVYFDLDNNELRCNSLTGDWTHVKTGQHEYTEGVYIYNDDFPDNGIYITPEQYYQGIIIPTPPVQPTIPASIKTENGLSISSGNSEIDLDLKNSGSLSIKNGDAELEINSTQTLFSAGSSRLLMLKSYLDDTPDFGTIYLDTGGYGDYRGTVQVYGSFIVSGGTKNAAVKTEGYDTRLQYCYETASPYFGDIGQGVTDENGECIISLDDIFYETIAGEMEYQVFLQKEGPGDLWVAEKTPRYFAVQGTENLKFAWELKAHQRNYKFERLEELDGMSLKEEIMKANNEADDLTKSYMDEINKVISGLEELLYVSA